MNKKEDAVKPSKTVKSTAAQPPVDSTSKVTLKNKKEKKVYDKTVTFKLDRNRFIQLKTLGLHVDKSSQTLLIEALDAYLATHQLP